MNASQLYFIPLGFSAPPGAAVFQTDVFSATPGQLSFILSMVPAAPVNLVFSVNGQVATVGLDYNVLGTTVNWLDTDFSMQLGDEVVAYYQV